MNYQYDSYQQDHQTEESLLHLYPKTSNSGICQNSKIIFSWLRGLV
jgi:hypothetical protein